MLQIQPAWNLKEQMSNQSAPLHHLILQRRPPTCVQKWLCHLGRLFSNTTICVPAVNHSGCVKAPPPTKKNKSRVWKMEEGKHAKWTYSPACRKITQGRTISHLLLPAELQMLHQTEGHGNLMKNGTRRKWKAHVKTNIWNKKKGLKS